MFYHSINPYIKKRTKKTFERGQIIYHEGDYPEYLYFIESGLVGLFHISPTGKETFFRVFKDNDILGHRSYFASGPYHASSIALSKVSLVMISKDECNRICEEHPALLREVTKQMAQDLGNSELRLAGLLDKTVLKRVSESLIFLKLKYPTHIWTRKEIGEYSGTSSESVTRVLTTLENENLLQRSGRDFTIMDNKALLSFIDQTSE